ncbi:MAG TPA: 3-oxoacyl-[acyl-carrier-protein] synthase III C-terminal domain-containing protein [Solirubrobacteraceae bacterium]
MCAAVPAPPNGHHRSLDIRTDAQTGGPSAFTRPVVARRARPSREGARIAALSISDQPGKLDQTDALDRLELDDDEFAQGIFAHCGVERRSLQLSDDLLELSLQGRTAQVEHELLSRSIDAIDAIDLDLAEIGTIVSASLYSLGVPTLAHRLVDHYAMDPTTDKYHVTGVGCASGVPLMKLAAQALPGHPGKHALVVAAESMSGILTRAGDDDSRSKTVGSSLFGDGCAVALLSADPRADGPLILASQVHHVAGTLGAVALECSDDDSHLHLARELPDIAGAELGAVVERFLIANDVAHEQIDHWLVHPGGRRIIENVRSALDLSNEQTAISWQALADHGNIGTPSIFYVLDETIRSRAPEPGERGLMVTIGPGVTLGLMLLGW